MIETIAKAGTKLTSVSNTVLTVRNVLIGLGLTEEEACDPKKIVPAVVRIVEKWYSEAENAFDYLISKNALNLILGAVTLALAIIGGAALAWASLLVGEFVFGNLIGGVFALVAAMLLILPGIELLLQYLLVKTLKELLQQRSQLCRLLSNDIQNIIAILQEYKALMSSWKKKTYLEIQRAISETLRAERLLGIEIGRVENNNRAVRVEVVRQSDRHIWRAISYLSGKGFNMTNKDILSIYNQYLPTTPIPGPKSSEQEWLSYYKDLNITLAKKYFTYEFAEDTPERAKEETQKTKIFKRILATLMKTLPDVGQTAMMKSALSASSNRLMEKFPIIGANASLLFNMKRLFNSGNYGVTATLLQEKFGLPISESGLSELFRKTNLKEATLQELTTRIKTYEALILLFPTMWKSIQTVGKMYIGILRLARTQVKDVRIDMQDSMTHRTNIMVKKLEWMAKLQLASHLLQPIINKNAAVKIPGLPEANINSAEIAEMMDASFPILEQLKEFIVTKSYNPETQKRKKEPIEAADALAQTALMPLLQNLHITLFPQNMEKMIAQLQSLKRLLNLQKKIDSIEFNISSAYIRVIENSPAFPQMMALYEYLLKVLEDSPINKYVAKLASGNISGLVAFYEGISDTNDMFDIMTCQKDKDAPAWYMEKLSPDIGLNTTMPSGTKELESLQKNTTKVLSKLQDDKKMIEEMLDAAIQKLNEVQLTDNAEMYDAAFQYESAT